MGGRIDLYNNAYEYYEADVYTQVRVETYGRDLGQTGWTTTEESDEIPRKLRLNAGSHVLEIGCGSGRYALQIAGSAGCRIIGVDVHSAGIANANRLAVAQGLQGLAEFQVVDASQALPFCDEAFDAVFSNDVLCHIPRRQALLREIFRVLMPGGRFLFSDALVIGGIVSHEELAARSSIGYYLFSPPCENERMMREAGFPQLEVVDTSWNAATIARRWHEARQKRGDALAAIEGPANFEGLQKFLSVVQKLTSERRLLRMLYFAEKPAA